MCKGELHLEPRADQKSCVRVAAYFNIGNDFQNLNEDNKRFLLTKYLEGYKKLVQEHDSWDFVSVYTDEGNTTDNVGWKKLLEDARSGKFDLIAMRSLGEFSTDLKDWAALIGLLKYMDPPVDLYASNLGRFVSDELVQLALIMLGDIDERKALKQRERAKCNHVQRFRKGKPMVNIDTVYGFQSGENGEWIAHPEESKVIQFMFEQFLAGKKYADIARILNDKGVTTKRGCQWTTSGVSRTLRNEIYVGDCKMQKTFLEPLTHRAHRNKGEYDSYYLWEHHKGLISRDTWNTAQEIVEKLAASRNGAVHG